MPHLKCYENGCKSNYCNHCILDSIKVGLDAYCHSHQERLASDDYIAKYEYEFAEDMGNDYHMDIHHIDCKNTQCKYQELGKCNHSNVLIDSRSKGPICISYYPK